MRIKQVRHRWGAVLHVDGLLIASSSDVLLHKLNKHLRSTDESITVKTGRVIDYVEMTFNFTNESKANVTTAHCVEGIATTLTGDNLVNVRETTTAAGDKQRWFYNDIAKIMYIPKRFKPECLTTIPFLAS